MVTFSYSNTKSVHSSKTALEVNAVSVFYGDSVAVRDVSLTIPKGKVTAFIGPSGCGKSTILRCFNRMNDLVPNARVQGQIVYQGVNLYSTGVDPVDIRRRIGMVFQRPNPFPKSIYENIAFGARINGYQGDLDELVELSLKKAALWDEVKDKLRASGLSLSGGQQQRLCIARAIALDPDILLMDEPCSALDPISTLKIEELINEIKQNISVIIVTHNMQQAARISDQTAFFNTAQAEGGKRFGFLVEYDQTSLIFNSPKQKNTQDYINGLFG